MLLEQLGLLSTYVSNFSLYIFFVLLDCREALNVNEAFQVHLNVFEAFPPVSSNISELLT